MKKSYLICFSLFLLFLLFPSCRVMDKEEDLTLEEKALRDRKYISSELAQEILGRWSYEEDKIDEEEALEESSALDGKAIDEERYILEALHRDMAESKLEK